jgi:subtilisin family serine protease
MVALGQTSSSRVAGAAFLILLVLLELAVSPSQGVVLFSRPSQAQNLAQGSNEYAPGELIIGLGTGSEDTLRDLVKSWGGDIVGELPQIHAYLVRLDEHTISASLDQHAAFAGFEYLERNYYVHSSYTPNDPLWPSQWASRKVRADLAWDIERGERSIIVAVIDTGIDYHHEDLAGSYLAIGYDWVNHDPDPFDDSATGHGTHVAGIIGAVTNNAIGITGLAQVSIMAEKVLDSGGSGTIYDAAEGVIDAANKGARITNNSYGTYAYSAILRDAFDYAWHQGVLNLAAAGNDNTDQPFYPAAFTEFVVSVAGTDQNDARYTLSNYGDWIELSAPAVAVVSTLPGNRYGEMTGTSQASPIASATAALVWSRCQRMSTEQVRRRLQESAVDLGDAGRDPYFGYGRLDLFSAVSMSCAIPAPPTPFEISAPLTPFEICVVQLGVQEQNGTVSWLPGYGWPGLPASQCPEKFEYYNDPVWDPPRTIVFHQFNQTRACCA